MYGWIDENMVKWMDGCMDGLMKIWINGWMDGWMDGLMKIWIDGWMDG